MSLNPDSPQGTPASADSAQPQIPQPHSPQPPNTQSPSTQPPSTLAPMPQPGLPHPQTSQPQAPLPPAAPSSDRNIVTILAITASVILGFVVAGIAAYSTLPSQRANEAPTPTTDHTQSALPALPLDTPTDEVDAAPLGKPDPSWKSSRQAVTWSSAWFEGSQELWTLPSPGADTKYTYGSTGNYLMANTPQGDSQTLITVYDITSSPREVLSRTVSKEEASRMGFWGDYIVTRNSLINLATGKDEELPWPANTGGFSTEWGLLQCDSTYSCSLWADPHTKTWTTQLAPTTGLLASQYANDANGGQWIMDGNMEWVLNMTTGEVKTIQWKTSIFANQPYAAIDGWIRTQSPDEGSNEILVDMRKADGSPYRTFTVNAVDSMVFSQIPWKEQAPSLAEYEKWLEESDVSWAESAIEAAQDSTCANVMIAGNKVEDPTGGTLVYRDEAAKQCVLGSGWSTPLHAWGRGNILPLGSPPILIDLKEGRSVEHPGLNAKNQFMLPRSDLVLIPQEDGSVIARAPR